MSLGLGVGLAFGPFPGLHVLIGMIASRLYRLNSVVVLLGTFFHNPWTMIPIHISGLMVGDLLLHRDLRSLQQFKKFPWGDLGLFTVFDGAFWTTNGPILLTFIKPFILGATLMGVLSGLISYKLTLQFLKRNQEDPS